MISVKYNWVGGPNYPAADVKHPQYNFSQKGHWLCLNKTVNKSEWCITNTEPLRELIKLFLVYLVYFFCMWLMCETNDEIETEMEIEIDVYHFILLISLYYNYTKGWVIQNGLHIICLPLANHSCAESYSVAWVGFFPLPFCLKVPRKGVCMPEGISHTTEDLK